MFRDAWLGMAIMLSLSSSHVCLQGAFIACNVRVKNLQRLEDVVGNALRRWAVRHKQDQVVSSYTSRA